MNGPARNHHTVPQTYLKGFARRRDLCVHRRDGVVETFTVKRLR
jgi:hypothetical protein